VRASLGKEYPWWIAGQAVRTEDWLRSVNPSRADEAMGLHAKTTADWARTPVAVVVKAAAIQRDRKNEFNASLVLEAGKSRAEAQADTAEAIEFCKYYARQMVRWAHPETLIQMPGERNELEGLPLGVGVVIPPWSFPLAILAGMTAAALVCGPWRSASAAGT